MPFSVSGTVDLLALFRCISCRFKFTTDVTDPSNMVSVRLFGSVQLPLNLASQLRQVPVSAGGSGQGVCLWGGMCDFPSPPELHLRPCTSFEKLVDTPKTSMCAGCSRNSATMCRHTIRACTCGYLMHNGAVFTAPCCSLCTWTHSVITLLESLKCARRKRMFSFHLWLISSSAASRWAPRQLQETASSCALDPMALWRPVNSLCCDRM